MNYTTSLLLLFALVKAQAQIQLESTNKADAYVKTITAADLSKHLHIIASDDYQGRETGKEGQKKAAYYLKEQFLEMGIKPLNDLPDGFYQEFPLNVIYPTGASIAVNEKEYVFPEDFYFFGGFSNFFLDYSEMVYLGYGIDEDNYSDYKGKEVKGKVGIVFKSVPDYLSETDKEKYSSNWRIRLEIAKKHGIRVLLIIDENYAVNKQANAHYFNKPSYKLEMGKDDYIPSIYISPEMAENVFKSTPLKYKKVKKRSDKNKAIKKPFFNKRVVFKFNRETQAMTSENVIAYIKGEDKASELLILTAHYDHIGVDGEQVYNGADDDGSGTVALLEIAEAFIQAKKDGNGPSRSVLIMPVSGEEKGLLGSEYYTENPIWPLENTIANLNIDMIGRQDKAHENNTNYIYLIGSDKLSDDLHNISEEVNKTYCNIELDYTYNDPADPNRYYYRSDHYNFAKNNIPVIFYFNGVHEDYHKPTDTVDKIDFNKMEKITRLVFLTAWELANREGKPLVNKQKL